MHASVSLLLVAAREATLAHVAGERLLAGVRAHVGGEVVAAAEAAQADAALEGLVAGVDANVAIELVGAREAALAALNRAGEWLLARRALPAARFGTPRVGGQQRVQERGRGAWVRDSTVEAVLMRRDGNLEV